ncbi:uncharacterized protein EV422DRAFT_572544 [Fimicolochytrium jonesii]|uniref:uncharacterized protein n=1 Tax=Fimicolochytrium jonesii TaxID=1396493 RepID=UPI0022FF2D13|nr:uncharacterized protein EV422DRAFT_572544 [Fimicolochytrium jonesii]KAI8815728.1 hypothetical protein EV422DRAFT_572544 [Fimicolochytrium jonesii]
MESVIHAILAAHNLLDSFHEARDFWSVEVQPAEGSTGFYLPLIIARDGPIVSLAHYTISTYDVDYDPLAEFEISAPAQAPSAWRLLSVYRFHAGFLAFDENGAQGEATRFVDEWVGRLRERGYMERSMGRIVWKAGGEEKEKGKVGGGMQTGTATGTKARM